MTVSLVLQNLPLEPAAWYPGIQRTCANWPNAPMLQQTFQAFEQAFIDNNDTIIDCAKSLVEVVCQTIIDEFHSSNAPFLPTSALPSLSEWLSAAIKALKLGDVRDQQFQKLVSSHHKLVNALNDLRNSGGPVSHGKDAYLERLSQHHRKMAVLAADTIIIFLFEAYQDIHLLLSFSREGYERLEHWNRQIDKYTLVNLTGDEESSEVLTLEFRLPNGEQIPLLVEPSKLLYYLDREAYISAKNAATSVQISDEIMLEDSVQDEVVTAV